MCEMRNAANEEGAMNRASRVRCSFAKVMLPPDLEEGTVRGRRSDIALLFGRLSRHKKLDVDLQMALL